MNAVRSLSLEALMELGIRLEDPPDRFTRGVRVIVDQWRRQFPDDIPRYIPRYVPGGVLFAPTPTWEPVRSVDISTLPDMWQELYDALHEWSFSLGTKFSFVTNQPATP